MRSWAAPGLRQWCAEVADDDAHPECERACVEESVRVAEAFISTCSQLQAFHAQHAAPTGASGAYAPLARLPVRLSIGTAKSVAKGLTRSYAGFLTQLASAANLPRIDPAVIDLWSEAAAKATKRLISSPNMGAVEEAAECSQLVAALRTNARREQRLATKTAIAKLGTDRIKLLVVRGDLLEFDRACGLACTAYRRSQALDNSARLWMSRLRRTASTSAWLYLVDAAPRLGAQLPLDVLTIPFDQDLCGGPGGGDGQMLRRALAPRVADAVAALGRLSERCSRMTERLPFEYDIAQATQSSPVIECASSPASTTNANALVLLPPAHLGAFGPEGRTRVKLQPRTETHAPESESALVSPLYASPAVATAWVLRAFADILESGQLPLGSIGSEYAARVVCFEYATHEAALLRLFDETLYPYGERVGTPVPRLRVVSCPHV